MDALNVLLEGLFFRFCTVAKWIFAFRVVSDVIKRGNESDLQGLLKAVGAGAVGYGTLYSIVYILNLVESTVIEAFK